jgi:uncharacterized protein YdaL
MKTRSVLFGVLLLAGLALDAMGQSPAGKVLVVVEGSSSLKSPAMGDGRQLGALLGHFTVTYTVTGVNDYTPGLVEKFDRIFYIGFHARNRVPARFLSDLLATRKQVIWLNTGFREFSASPAVRRRFGFRVVRLDSTSKFTEVRAESKTFMKGEPNLNVVEIVSRQKANVVATAFSPQTKRELPYIVSSGNLLYFGDCPFASVSETDRYLLFADMLHDILGQPHKESHTALIRIEDVNPMANPDRLRDVADILSARGVPFLVGVSPFYVNPGEGIRVSLSEKPDLVDALRYMVQNGGTIVMHGVTHQYKRVTGSDYEFWDEATNGPVLDETVEAITRKLDMGIQEFMRNGLYPLVWETPHYTASTRLYETIAKYFSTAVEQRLSIEDVECGQFFPYVIQSDLYGQRIYPENLGYVPLDADPKVGEEAVRRILEGAKAHLSVRDGFASCFFHAFVDPALLKEIIDGVEKLGYEYLDLREQTNWVHLKDRVILSGSQEFSLNLDDQYLAEAYFEQNGDVERTAVSEKRLTGVVTRTVDLAPGQFYRAEPTEFHEKKENFVDNVVRGAEDLYRRVFHSETAWQEARCAILWNHYARGAAYNDQASFAAVMRSVSIPVDTFFIGEGMNLASYNLLIIPYSVVDSLRQSDFDMIVRFVEEGGNLITDLAADVVEDFGFTLTGSRLKVNKVQDRLFPEERIRWRYSELAMKFDAEEIDEVFCVDEVTEAPLVVGRRWKNGRLIFLATRFDPYSQRGYSMYPYLMEYVRQYFHLGPIVRRDQLEVYFDPGFRRTLSIEQLVRQWVSQGIRVVHAAGWHQYPQYTYDYERLIRLAHANGILVYAWIEPPQVSQKFYREHPEWREKNHRGEDIQPSWRFPMAMTDDGCLKAMVQEYRTLLESHAWDGVNLAELYFEAAKGLRDPHYFTPMHISAQREFKKRYGINLPEIFDPQSPHYWKTDSTVAEKVSDYRVRALNAVYERILAMILEVAHEKSDFQTIVTVMDELGSPELREYIGVDVREVLALQRKHGFLLQVEDPQHLWSTDPDRYQAIGKRYAELTGGRTQYLLDLNIGSFRKPESVTPFPTLIQTGTESFLLVNAAAAGSERYTIYAESSVNPQDMMYLPYANAREVHYTRSPLGYEVNAPFSFAMKLPSDVSEILLDGVPLSAGRENMYLIPAGTHTIRSGAAASTAFSAHELETRILSSTANILSVSYALRSVNFVYDSGMRTLIALNREPTAVTVDGEEYPLTFFKGNDCYTLYLPPGRHAVELVAGSPFSYGISFTSFWSTTAIAVFGSLAVFSLLAMYLALKVIRRRGLAVESGP